MFKSPYALQVYKSRFNHLNLVSAKEKKIYLVFFFPRTKTVNCLRMPEEVFGLQSLVSSLSSGLEPRSNVSFESSSKGESLIGSLLTHVEGSLQVPWQQLSRGCGKRLFSLSFSSLAVQQEESQSQSSQQLVLQSSEQRRDFLFGLKDKRRIKNGNWTGKLHHHNSKVPFGRFFLK